MLINQTIPNLFQGVSQQPSALKLSTQGDIQENAYSSLVEGLKKRPPTIHLAKLRNSTATDAFVHVINRDTTERYVVVFLSGSVEVYGIDGTAKTVNTLSADAISYLTTTTPRTDFSAVTIADYTFLVNKTKVTALSAATDSANTNTCYFFVTNCIQNISYAVQVDGVTATYASGTNTSSQAITAALATNLGTALGAGYTVTNTIDNVIKVVKGTGSLTSAGSSDGWGNNAVKTILGRVQRFADLPPKFESGYVIQIAGDSGNAFSSYYVQWDTTSGTGVWKEVVKPGLQNTPDGATMPYKLVRESNGTFTFAKVTWASRAAGDTLSNPPPSFIGRKINGVFYYRNRLGFLSDENVILSRTSNFLDFWNGTASTVLDTDRIDVSVVTTKVAILRHAVPFASDLMLFADQQQFKLTAPTNTGLTARSITIAPSTAYQMSSSCPPVPMGQNVYFATDKGGYTAVREYYVQPMTYSNTADDVTSHVPTYLPSGTFRLMAGLTDDILFSVNTTNRNEIYVYKFFFGGESGNQKVQSAWSVWKLDASDVILSGEVLDTKLYLVIQRADGVYLEYINFQPNLTDADLGVLVHLDRRTSLTGVYSSGTGLTTWTLPYADTTPLQVVLSGSWGPTKGQIPTITQATSTTITAVGDYSAHPAYVGRIYTMRYRFSELIFRDPNKVAVFQNRLLVKYMDIVYANSGYFTAAVTPQFSPSYTYIFTGQVLGSTSVIGSVNTASGTFRVPVLSNSVGCHIEIQNNSYLPCAIQSAEWNANMNFNFRRI